eukprot:CAMPEP_0198570276 /NCGR_PEP_ID=MMETSP1462-20131121/108893_1 /TAXON_ID=1333877 /ORGANISM="Brandtodinium nutriculum, Strain RCC3387" /LENGTH=83 /DNA_ID=CAMNT_0044301391 /DNA_START=174 /DNA_END=425 /DNA_ORIENTATION=-
MAQNSVFSNKYKFSFPLLCDVARSLPAALSVSSGRWAVLVNEDRTVAQFWPQVDDLEMFPVQPLSFVATQKWEARTAAKAEEL